MSISSGQFIFVDPGPPAAQCVTVKTNQVALLGSHPEPGQSGTWTAPGGGEGTHFSYQYQVNQADPLLHDQYIVMSSWNLTNFIAGEVLTLTP